MAAISLMNMYKKKTKGVLNWSSAELGFDIKVLNFVILADYVGYSNLLSRTRKKKMNSVYHLLLPERQS